MILGPNERETAAFTWGIARNLWTDLPNVGPSAAAVQALPAGDGLTAVPDPENAPLPLPAPADAVLAASGGGDLNGTAALILFAQAGTAADRLASPRKPPNSGNYCGVV